jgi:GST-like protein
LNQPKDTAAVAKVVENLTRDGAVLNKQLEGKQYIANNEFSLVDICLITYIIHIFDEPEIQDWFKMYPNIAAWYKSVAARPAFKQVTDLHKW